MQLQNVAWKNNNNNKSEKSPWCHFCPFTTPRDQKNKSTNRKLLRNYSPFYEADILGCLLSLKNN